MTTLHAHTRDAAQEGFDDACKVAKTQHQMGLETRYPHRRKWYRTTTWKSIGLRLRDGGLWLSRARGLAPIRVALPADLSAYPAYAYKQVKLVWDQAARHYTWHITIEDGAEPVPTPGSHVVAVDRGESRPAALTDGREAVVITARRLRATRQYTAKCLSELQAKQSGKTKGAGRWKRLQRRKHRFLAQQQRRRTHDIEHKVSRAVVDWAVECQASTLAVGDMRDVADGKRMGAQSQQKIGLWSQGKMRWYLIYKAQAAGIQVELVGEHGTSKTCPRCRRQYKPTGRVYRCPKCGLVAHRDVVGSVNILSRKLHGELAMNLPPALSATMSRYAAWVSQQGKRSRPDTPELARACVVPRREAAGL
ncbi:MAG TPA: transposase [Ktedonobacterales bacterium]|nr:transposase [Ktedonobacterales bacterium]